MDIMFPNMVSELIWYPPWRIFSAAFSRENSFSSSFQFSVRNFFSFVLSLFPIPFLMFVFLNQFISDSFLILNIHHHLYPIPYINSSFVFRFSRVITFRDSVSQFLFDSCFEYVRVFRFHLWFCYNLKIEILFHVLLVILFTIQIDFVFVIFPQFLGFRFCFVL